MLNLDAGAGDPGCADEIWYFLGDLARPCRAWVPQMESSALLRGKYPELRGMADESFFSKDGLEQLFSGIESAGKMVTR